MVIRLDEAFSKGSAKILQNKNLVKDLANAIRYDVDDNPNFFPRNAVNTFPRMQDAQLAEWFLGELDRMEQEGYEGTKLTSDGSINDWVVKKYIAGAHNWEDLTGKLQQQLHNWVNLKKFGLLKPEHQNIPSFNGVLDLGKYMVGHYSNELKDLQNEIKKAALKKKAKSAVIVNNDDYKIYVTLNRSANQLTGANTTWCTTSAASDYHWNSYSNQAMLFQLFPKDAEFVSLEKEGREHPIEGAERYQFGADSGYSFMDIADHRYPAEKVRERWPYLWDDLKSALQQQAGKLEGIMKSLSEDPHMQDPDVKIKTYNVQKEINKLEKFKNKGYFTDEVRPAVEPELKAAADSGQEQPKLNPPAEGQPQMESIRELARMMIEGRDLDEGIGRWPAQAAARRAAAAAGNPVTGKITRTPTGLTHHAGDAYSGEWSEKTPPGQTDYEAGAARYMKPPRMAATYANLNKDQAGIHPEEFDEEDEIDEEGEPDAAATGGELGSMGGGAGPSGGGQYPPGTAPTMPESFNYKGKITMENVDKDVAAMLKNLKKYDMLVESCAPVLMARPKPYVAEKKEAEEDIEEAKAKVDKEDDEEQLDEDGIDLDAAKKSGAKVTIGKSHGPRASEKDGFKSSHIGGAGQKQGDQRGGKANVSTSGGSVPPVVGSGKKRAVAEVVAEGADPEVLEWMKRFASLGNMKGYGR